MKLVCVSLLCICSSVYATLPTEQETVMNRGRIERLLEQSKLVQPQCFSVPEGGFVYAFHPSIYPWLEKPLDVETVRKIASELAPHLKLTLTKEGFAQASTRRTEDEVDATGYNAIWVRDCCWVYYALKIQNPSEARRLILSLLGFYSTNDQIERFLKVITDPTVADSGKNPSAMMDVPLIRFSSKTLGHYLVDGKPQEWNHLQFDSHGLFLHCVIDALTTGVISIEDLTEKHFDVLALIPPFFNQTRYWEMEDAGPWEENFMWNASSAGIVASGLKRLWGLVEQNKLLREGIAKTYNRLEELKKGVVQQVREVWSPQAMSDMINKGLFRVGKDLNLGGEAPNFDGKGIDRTADAALLFLCIPEGAFYANHPERMKQILAIDASLVGPNGVNRYPYDAYQGANFWIDYNLPSKIEGPVTQFSLFATRLQKGFMPDKNAYSAQWFFDSLIALVYYNLSQLEKGDDVKRYYLGKGDLHLKRSLGQLTGPKAYASNGEKILPIQLAESINTIIDSSGKPWVAPSPICPLGWATAALQLALAGAEKAHSMISTEAKVQRSPTTLNFKSL